MSDFQAEYWEKVCDVTLNTFEDASSNLLEFKPLVRNYIVDVVCLKWNGKYPLDLMLQEECIDYCVNNMKIQRSLLPHLTPHFTGRAYIKMAHFLMLKCYYQGKISTQDCNTLLAIAS